MNAVCTKGPRRGSYKQYRTRCGDRFPLSRKSKHTIMARRGQQSSESAAYTTHSLSRVVLSCGCEIEVDAKSNRSACYKTVSRRA